MDGTRITVTLDSAEAAALFKAAQSEFRHPREQIRFALRADLQRRGLLIVDQVKETAKVGQNEQRAL